MEPGERGEALLVDHGEADGGLQFDQVLGNLEEQVVEVTVVRRTVVAQFEHQDQLVLRLLGKLVIGVVRRARIKVSDSARLIPKQRVEIVDEEVLDWVVFEGRVILQALDVVEALIPAVVRPGIMRAQATPHLVPPKEPMFRFLMTSQPGS